MSKRVDDATKRTVHVTIYARKLPTRRIRTDGRNVARLDRADHLLFGLALISLLILILILISACVAFHIYLKLLPCHLGMLMLPYVFRSHSSSRDHDRYRKGPACYNRLAPALRWLCCRSSYSI